MFNCDLCKVVVVIFIIPFWRSIATRQNKQLYKNKKWTSLQNKIMKSVSLKAKKPILK